MTRSEDQEQEIVCRWLESRAIPYFHVPNEGNRAISYAIRMKRLGLKSGIPDLIIVKPHPDGRHIAIEMKSEGGRLSDTQKVWHSIMSKNGWYVVTCYGAEKAIGYLSAVFS